MKNSKEDAFAAAILIVAIGAAVLVVASSSIRGAIRDTVLSFFVLAILFMLEKIADNGKT